MFLFKRIKIRTHEMGLYFRDGEFKGLLRAGKHWLFDPLGKARVEVVSQRAPWLAHEKLDSLVGVADRREVRLRLHDEVARVEAVHGHRIGRVGDVQGEGEVVGVRRRSGVRHAPTLPARRLAAGTALRAGSSG